MDLKNRDRARRLIQQLSDPSVPRYKQWGILTDLSIELDDEVIKQLKPLGLFHKYGDKRVPPQYKDIDWMYLFLRDPTANPNHTKLCEPIAWHLLKDSGRLDSARSNAMDFLIRHYWKMKKDELLQIMIEDSIIFSPTVIGEHINAIEDISIYIKVLGRNRIKDRRPVASQIGLLKYLTEKRTSLWSFVNESNDFEFICGSLIIVKSWLFESKITADNLFIVEEMMVNLSDFMTHNHPEVRRVASTFGWFKYVNHYDQFSSYIDEKVIINNLKDPEPIVRAAAFAGLYLNHQNVPDWTIITPLLQSQNEDEFITAMKSLLYYHSSVINSLEQYKIVREKILEMYENPPDQFSLSDDFYNLIREYDSDIMALVSLFIKHDNQKTRGFGYQLIYHLIDKVDFKEIRHVLIENYRSKNDYPSSFAAIFGKQKDIAFFEVLKEEEEDNEVILTYLSEHKFGGLPYLVYVIRNIEWHYHSGPPPNIFFALDKYEINEITQNPDISDEDIKYIINLLNFEGRHHDEDAVKKAWDKIKKAER